MRFHAVQLDALLKRFANTIFAIKGHLQDVQSIGLGVAAAVFSDSLTTLISMPVQATVRLKTRQTQ